MASRHPGGAELARARASVSYETTFGPAWVAFQPDGLIETGLPGAPNPYRVHDEPPIAVARLARGLAQYWETGDLPPIARGEIARTARTPLDELIYECVVAIPAGATMTYAAVAASVGRRGAARAVGTAMAANRLAPLIPCHRVVGSDGSLRGYAGGLAMKRYLLDLEAQRRG